MVEVELAAGGQAAADSVPKALGLLEGGEDVLVEVLGVAALGGEDSPVAIEASKGDPDLVLGVVFGRESTVEVRPVRAVGVGMHGVSSGVRWESARHAANRARGSGTPQGRGATTIGGVARPAGVCLGSSPQPGYAALDGRSGQEGGGRQGWEER